MRPWIVLLFLPLAGCIDPALEEDNGFTMGQQQATDMEASPSEVPQVEATFNETLVIDVMAWMSHPGNVQVVEFIPDDPGLVRWRLDGVMNTTTESWASCFFLDATTSGQSLFPGAFGGSFSRRFGTELRVDGKTWYDDGSPSMAGHGEYNGWPMESHIEGALRLYVGQTGVTFGNDTWLELHVEHSTNWTIRELPPTWGACGSGWDRKVVVGGNGFGEHVPFVANGTYGNTVYGQAWDDGPHVLNVTVDGVSDSFDLPIDDWGVLEAPAGAVRLVPDAWASDDSGMWVWMGW